MFAGSVVVRNIIGVVVPWLLPGVVDLLDAGNVIPPVALATQILLCAVATCATLSVVLRAQVATVARQAPVAEAMRHGYQLAREHCRTDHGTGQHRAAVGQAAPIRFGGGPSLRLVQSEEALYGGGNGATAAYPLVPRTLPAPSPRQSRQR